MPKPNGPASSICQNCLWGDFTASRSRGYCVNPLLGSATRPATVAPEDTCPAWEPHLDGDALDRRADEVVDELARSEASPVDHPTTPRRARPARPGETPHPE